MQMSAWKACWLAEERGRGHAPSYQDKTMESNVIMIRYAMRLGSFRRQSWRCRALPRQAVVLLII
jgi:hypothetical protein